MSPIWLRSAPSLFNNYANALHWIMANNYGAQLLHYLDDFLLVGPPDKDTCQEAMYRMLLVCDQLGIPVASEQLALYLHRVEYCHPATWEAQEFIQIYHFGIIVLRNEKSSFT